jgi:hypothetical protein
MFNPQRGRRRGRRILTGTADDDKQCGQQEARQLFPGSPPMELGVAGDLQSKTRRGRRPPPGEQFPL